MFAILFNIRLAAGIIIYLQVMSTSINISWQFILILL